MDKLGDDPMTLLAIAKEDMERAGLSEQEIEERLKEMINHYNLILAATI